MSDFPTISDLMNPTLPPKTSKSPTPESDTTGKKVLTKKMGEIKNKELEVEAVRFAVSIGIPHIDLTKFPITHEALRQITREEATAHGVVCFFAGSDEIRIGALDPTTGEAEEILKDIEIKKTRTWRALCDFSGKF